VARVREVEKVMTTFAQYCRAERAAGGVHCTTRQFIRGCHTLIHKQAKGRGWREQRHIWIRNMLEERSVVRNTLM
jgi:hypothetical protein